MRTCRVCREKFQPYRSMQPTCQKFECQNEYAQRVAQKAAEKRAKAERRALNERKMDLKPIQYWLRRAQVAVNAYCREFELQAGYGCITCGTYDAEQWHAGHWISVGASSATRFDPANIHLQCRQCNYFGAGMATEYERWLPSRIGQSEVDRIKYAKREKRWTREECQAIEVEFKQKLKDLKRVSGQV